jgi:hypothetical protein
MRFDVRTNPVCQLMGGELHRDVCASVLLEDFATFMTFLPALVRRGLRQQESASSEICSIDGV